MFGSQQPSPLTGREASLTSSPGTIDINHHTLAHSPHVYTTASSALLPYCANAEGWGPKSLVRFDFTPCFLDAWFVVLAALTLVAGACFALPRLWRGRVKFRPTHHGFFWLRQSTTLALIVYLILQRSPPLPQSNASSSLPFSPHQLLNVSVLAHFLLIPSLLVIFAIQWLEYSRLRHPHDLPIVYWILLSVLLALRFQSLLAQNLHIHEKQYFTTFSITASLAIVSAILEKFSPRRRFATCGARHLCRDEEEIEMELKNDAIPLVNADILSRTTFAWLSPLLATGYQEFLTEAHVYPLARNHRSDVAYRAFDRAWQNGVKRNKGSAPNLYLTLLASHGWDYARAIPFMVAFLASNAYLPMYIKHLIAFVETHQGNGVPDPAIKGFAIGLVLLATPLVNAVLLQQYLYHTFSVGLKVNMALDAAVYEKSLRLSNEGRRNRSIGEIVNVLSIDAYAITSLVRCAHRLWAAPVQIMFVLYYLYLLLDHTFPAGIGVAFIMAPTTYFLSRWAKSIRAELMQLKDKRSRIIEESLSNMQSVKLFAWAPTLLANLSNVRNDKELKTLQKSFILESVSKTFWASAPYFIAFFTFIAFSEFSQIPLTIDIIFPALALINQLAFPMRILPTVISLVVQSNVSCRRIESFLMAEEAQPDSVERKPAKDNLGDDTVVVRNGTFTWDRHDTEHLPVLRHINYTAYKGELSCIIGRIGSGKSSLLQSLIGDLWKVNGNVQVCGKVAYVPQQPWILDATVRENILFGLPYDPQYYQKTLKVCCLPDDLAQYPDGDATLVGERGINLSGGQKARVALARAVYSRADIYILDDVLSAIDAHVGKSIVHNVLGPRGILKSTTRILATNTLHALRHSGYVTFLQDGEIAEHGTYVDLVTRNGIVSKLLKSTGHIHGDESSTSSSSSSSSVKDAIMDQDPTELLDHPPSTLPGNESSSGANDDRQINHDCRTSSQSVSSSSTATSPTTPQNAAHLVDNHKANADPEQAVVATTTLGVGAKRSKEHREIGQVKLSNYLHYINAANVYMVGVYFVVLLVSHAATFGGAVWMKTWSGSRERATSAATGANWLTTKADGKVIWYLVIYLLINLGGSILSTLKGITLFLLCTLSASRKLHEQMAYAVFRAPMSFFHVTPAGRIMNRFTVDINKLDTILPETFYQLCDAIVEFFVIVCMVTISTPPFIIVIIFLSFLYVSYQRYYVCSMRELLRLNSVTRSPIFVNLQETLGGLSTIRAFQQQKRFSQENDMRLDKNVEVRHSIMAAQRWLAVRLASTGAVAISAAALFVVLSVLSGKHVSTGLVGLSMSYALNIMDKLSYIVRSMSSLETNIIVVERIIEYTKLPSEAPEFIPERQPPPEWPANGAITLQKYSTRYRDDLDMVLRDIDIQIKPGEKIGVVGRTGAGKSSLTLALFRILEASQGHIEIDGIDTSTLGLHDVRKNLAIIPQDTDLFTGTLRSNLDPRSEYTDEDLWTVLDHAQLRQHVEKLDGQLYAEIAEKGNNLSQGQQQLISIARALLTSSSVLVLDEATAAVDMETDVLLQQVLRNPMVSKRTIITIAHRIHSILDSDRVLVLDKGRVVEFDSPKALLSRKGAFYGLVSDADLLGGSLIHVDE